MVKIIQVKQFLQIMENRTIASFFLAIESFKLGGNYVFKDSSVLG